MTPCRVVMEACVGAHHLGRRVEALGHEVQGRPGRCGDFAPGQSPPTDILVGRAPTSGVSRQSDRLAKDEGQSV